MENYYKYSNKYRSKKNLTEDKKNELVMLRMILTKLKNKYNCKNNKELGKLLGCSADTISNYINGKSPIPSYFIEKICFLFELTPQQIKDRVATLNDEYLNSKGHLIIDGVDYGLVDDNYKA